MCTYTCLLVCISIWLKLCFFLAFVWVCNNCSKLRIQAVKWHTYINIHIYMRLYVCLYIWSGCSNSVPQTFATKVRLPVNIHRKCSYMPHTVLTYISYMCICIIIHMYMYLCSNVCALVTVFMHARLLVVTWNLQITNLNATRICMAALWCLQSFKRLIQLVLFAFQMSPRAGHLVTMILVKNKKNIYVQVYEF